MLGEEIRKNRTLRGVTQRDLAKMVDVKPNTMCQYELGKSEVSFGVLRKIAQALSCSTIELAYEELDIRKPDTSKSSVDMTVDSNDVSTMGRMVLEMFESLDIKRKYKVLDYIREQIIVANHYKRS